MELAGYKFDIEKAISAIKKNRYKNVALQIPEGLKRSVFAIVDYLEKETSATFLISADTCFGACDVANHELKNSGVDFVVHIGHTPIPNIKNFRIPTMFLNAESDIDVSKAVEKAVPLLKGKKIGLVSTAQHVHTLDIAEKILIKNNFKPVIGKGDKRIALKGQILGCNFSAATSIASKVDSFLFIGSGNFHPLGLLLATKKPVVAVDPYINIVKERELKELKDKILRQRYGAIARSKDAKTFGILIGIKRGQQRMKLTHKIKKMLDSKQKKSYFISLNNFSPSELQGFRDIDCFVSTACPRIAIDDYMRYKVPIITPVELEILLGKKKWDDYEFDQILE
jgi:2-(3-amino-3-carboxypropyl)histidine synthase